MRPTGCTHLRPRCPPLTAHPLGPGAYPPSRRPLRLTRAQFHSPSPGTHPCRQDTTRGNSPRSTSRFKPDSDGGARMRHRAASTRCVWVSHPGSAVGAPRLKRGACRRDSQCSTLPGAKTQSLGHPTSQTPADHIQLLSLARNGLVVTVEPSRLRWWVRKHGRKPAGGAGDTHPYQTGLGRFTRGFILVRGRGRALRNPHERRRQEISSKS